jgi:hypothetical protein
MHQVGREQREPEPERHSPHQREPVRLDERLEQQVRAVAHRADRRVERLRDNVVHALGEAADRRRQPDRADAGHADRLLAEDDRDLHHQGAAARGHDQRPGEGEVLAEHPPVEAEPDRIRAGRQGGGAAHEVPEGAADHEAPVTRPGDRQRGRHGEPHDGLDRLQ